ncbi:unnamed protein product [Cuscuta campestris]|uniref:Uncharacterized protein n=1 Tax=Cuscuta campestris TaxID=132261 RepID=A0A484M858_9ASTE|nr:unnamed protein product [Cuscuta campestris]
MPRDSNLVSPERILSSSFIASSFSNIHKVLNKIRKDLAITRETNTMVWYLATVSQDASTITGVPLL